MIKGIRKSKTLQHPILVIRRQEMREEREGGRERERERAREREKAERMKERQRKRVIKGCNPKDLRDKQYPKQNSLANYQN